MKSIIKKNFNKLFKEENQFSTLSKINPSIKKKICISVKKCSFSYSFFKSSQLIKLAVILQHLFLRFFNLAGEINEENV